METLAIDLRHAARGLARRPGFTIAATLTLALGIGACTAIFGFVNAVLLRPLPYADPGRLVWVTNVIPQFQAEMAGGGDFVDWRDQSRSLEAIGAYSDGATATLRGRHEPERIRAARVSSGLLPTLGIVPSAGRNFLPEEDKPAGPKSVVVSARLWRRLLPGVAPGEERSVELDGAVHAIVGVLPADFVFPGSLDVDILLPLGLDEASERARGRQKIVKIIGRLRPGVTPKQARAELKQIQSVAMATSPNAPRDGVVVSGSSPNLRRSSESVPPEPAPSGPKRRPTFEMILKVIPLQQALVADVRPGLLLFSVAVGLVLAMACANVANLLLARTSARRQEMAVRAALGAGRARLVRQLLTESALIALLGGVIGALLAAVAISGLLALMPLDLAGGFRSARVGLDARVFAFTFLLSLMASVLAALAPALLASRSEPIQRLREGSPSISPGASRRRLRGLLVGGEVALAFVLLVGGGLLVRSLHRLLILDPGFRADQVMTVALELDEGRHSTPAAHLAFIESLLDRVRAVPGVQSAAAGDSVPLRSFSQMMSAPDIEGRPKDPPGRAPASALCSVTEDYFRTMGIRVDRGRAFGPEDRQGAPEVAIVNETLARRFWGSTDALGKRLRFGDKASWWTVVGIAADVRHEALEAQPRSVVYRPFAQDTRRFSYMAVKASVEPTSLVASLRREVASLDPGLAVDDVATMRGRLSAALAPRRFNTTLLGAFAASALLLAAVGVYGVMAYMVTERTREMGIRIAIGASPSQVRALVLRQGLATAAAGVLVGGGVALAASHVLHGALYGVGPADTLTFALVATLLLAVCWIASELPARRATRVDPSVALRTE
jgi:putative ABC transport system permease protein